MIEARALLDAWSAWIGLGFLAGLFALFAIERLPTVVIAVVGAALMLLLGYLPREEMEQVFANPAPITIAAMFVLSGALIRTGVVEALASAALNRAARSPRRSLAELFGGTFFASSLVNNTPVVMVLVPIMQRIAAATRMGPRRLLIPLSYVSILGGSLTLIGTSTNLLVDGVAQRLGARPFGMFELTGVGLITSAVGVAMLLTAGRRLLPGDESPDAHDTESPVDDRYLTEWTIAADDERIGRTYGELPELRRSGIRAVALQRDTELRRRAIDDETIAGGDRLILAIDEAELLSLGESHGSTIGVSKSPAAPAEQGRVVKASIAPSHPAIGRQLSDIPFLAKTQARVLGLSRARHFPGPSLSQARLRAADSLLIRGSEDCVGAIEGNVNLIHLDSPEMRPYRRLRAPIAIVTMLGILTLAALGVTSIELLAIVGVAVVLATRCIDPEEAWRSIDGNVLVLIFGMLGVGVGLQNAGTIDLIVDAAIPLLTNAPPFLVLLLVYALTSVLTEMVTNNAVAVIMTPLVLTLGADLGMDARPLLFAVMFAASASFATPIGYQTNTIVHAAGGYRFADFVRIGLPMNAVVGLATCLAITWLV